MLTPLHLVIRSPIRSLIETGFGADKRNDVRLYYGATNLNRMAYRVLFYCLLFLIGGLRNCSCPCSSFTFFHIIDLFCNLCRRGFKSGNQQESILCKCCRILMILGEGNEVLCRLLKTLGFHVLCIYVSLVCVIHDIVCRLLLLEQKES